MSQFKKSFGIFSCLLALLVLPSCAGNIQPTLHASSGPAPGEAKRIQAGDNLFDPSEIEVEAGQPVTLEVINTGLRPHDLTIDSLDVSTGVMGAGEIMHLTFTAPSTEVEFVCTLHRGMVGTLKVA